MNYLHYCYLDHSRSPVVANGDDERNDSDVDVDENESENASDLIAVVDEVVEQKVVVDDDGAVDQNEELDLVDKLSAAVVEVEIVVIYRR